MMYSFTVEPLKVGNKTYLPIPFNVWEKCEKKGMIPVIATVEGISFECKLLPKGGGNYFIPIIKSLVNQIDKTGEWEVQFDIIEKLSRIIKDSPYCLENPIRKIDGIDYIKQPSNGYCGQTCIAMLVGVTLDEVINVMHSRKWQASLSKIIETLDYYGLSHADKFIYTKGKMVDFPKCCIINVREEPKNHLMIYYNGTYYDPAFGILKDYHSKMIISYMEIFT